MSNGSFHWFEQRFTATLFVISTLFCIFVYFIFYRGACPMISLFFSCSLLVAILSAIRHGYLGIQVILQDYIANISLRATLICLIGCISLLCCIFASVSIVKQHIIQTLRSDIKIHSEVNEK